MAGLPAEDTERDRTLAWLDRQLEAVHTVAEAGDAAELADLLPVCVRVAADATESDFASLYLLEASTSELVLGACTRNAGAFAQQHARVPAGSVMYKTAHRLQPRALHVDAWPEPPRSDMRAAGFVELALVPLRIKGQAAGSLNLGRASARPYAPHELRAAQMLADQIAVQIEKARLRSESHRSTQDLVLINELGRLISEQLDLPAVLEAGMQLLSRIVDAPQSFVMLLEPDGATLRTVASNVREPDVLGLLISPDEPSILNRAVRDRAPVVVADTSVNDGGFSPTRVALFRQTALLAVPLAFRGKPIGAVLLGETRAGRAFGPGEVARAVAMANQLAAAIANARLFDDLRRSYRELERAQQQLVRRERLAALGELAASVAHEVRNPLGVIFNSIAGLARCVPEAPEPRLLLGILTEESERLNRIVGELLDFARPSEPSFIRQPLEPVVAGAAEAAASALGEPSRRLALALAPGLPHAAVDGELLRQALINLIVNALQASPAGGAVAIRAAEGAAEGRRVVCIEVENQGPAISPGVLAHIFEPFFTTKATGTGLGLALVKRIVEAHRGEVRVARSDERGTVFVVQLPLDP